MHYSLFFFVIISLFSTERGFYLLALAFALLHECAHALAAILCSEKPQRINVTPFGFELKMKNMSYKNELKIAAAGPFLSGVLGLIGYGFNLHTVRNINLVLFLINLMPALPLDGGRILRIILWKTMGFARGNSVSRRASRISAALLFVFAFFPPFSPWLIIVAMVIFSYVEQRPQSFILIKKDFSKGPMPVKWFCADSDTDVISICRFFSPFYYTMVYIPSKDTYHCESEITEALKTRGAHIKIGDLPTRFNK